MDLSKHYEEFRDALLHAFTIDELEMRVQFDLDEDLDDIVGPGPSKKRVYDLIKWCNGEGRVEELFIAALKKKPGNPKLRALSKKLAKESLDEHTEKEKAIRDRNLGFNSLDSPDADEIRNITNAGAGSDGLQALVVAAPHLNTSQDLEAWDSKYKSAKNRVCSIGAGSQHAGTGFLVGDDRIITNSHVLANAGIATADVAFDYVGSSSRDGLTKYKIAEELIRSEPKELDFVIFRLDKTPEGDRGYFPARSYHFDKVREPVHLLGHPDGLSMRLAYGVIFDSYSYLSRISYTANTKRGSSGSPVFLENWDLAAIHHHGETGVNNHGIPMEAILAHLKAKGKEGLMERQS